MLCGVISDIHGNIFALEKTISFLKKLRVDGYVILGDVVNYLPWSNECIDILINLEHKFLILGNHEEYFLKVSEPINPIVKKFLDINLKNFTRYSALKNFKKFIKIDDFTFCHTINNKYIYEDTKINFKKNYVLGHSHSQYFKKQNNKLILNPGSVGQNRKNLNVINFMSLNTETKNFQMHSIEYDFTKIILDSLKKHNYTNDCINFFKNRL